MLNMSSTPISDMFVNGETPQSITVYSPGVGISMWGASSLRCPCLLGSEKQKYDQVGTRVNLHYHYHWRVWLICITCTSKLIHHIEQKTTRRYYTYLVFTKIHPDIAQYAIQHWNYSIPDIKYYR